MRRRVLLLVGATTSLVLIAFLVPLAVLVRGVAADRAVQGALVQAQSLSPLVATADRDSLELAVAQVDGTTPYEVSVFLSDGTRLGADVPRSPLVELAARGSSESGDVPGGREIVFAVGDGTSTFHVIRAFVPRSELTRGVARAWLLLGLLGVALLAVSLLVADRLAGRLVRSTIELAGVSHRLAGGDLTARADPADSATREIGTVAGALNHLARRIAELLREEREAIADLSHRVRTPLTALRLEAEALRDAAEARRIGERVEAVQRTVTQAIEEARRRSTDLGAGSDAAEVVRERVDFWTALAEDTDRALHRDLVPGPLPVAVGAGDLAACVDALLGNVFAHTADGTELAVTLRPRPGGGALLVVDDAGPGLPESGLAERGVSGAGSSGLGLDIVRRTAERTGGTLRLERSPRGGLRATVELLASP